MYVIPVAHTVFQPMTAKKAGWISHGADTGSSSADELAEFAGRNCYQSWNRPNPATATNEGYLANILGMGHESVLEHASVTFYVSHVSRALLTELTRHRFLSFSVVSQRYVDANDLDTVEPPALFELDGYEGIDFARAFATIHDHADKCLEVYNELVEKFTAAGLPRKRAREAARSVLPHSTESPMVVTGNIRAWRDVLGKRHHKAADRELQEFASEILWNLRGIAPNSVSDFEDKFPE